MPVSVIDGLYPNLEEVQGLRSRDMRERFLTIMAQLRRCGRAMSVSDYCRAAVPVNAPSVPFPFSALLP